MTDSKVNHSSYKKSSKKCNHKKEIKFKEDFSKLLEKVYTQNSNKHRCNILSTSQLKTYKRKREILGYEEDISSKLKRMKLYDMDDDDNNTENESLCSSIHPSNPSVYPKVSGYALDSYINDTENNAFFRSERFKVLHFEPMNECLEGNELQTLLFPVNPATKKDIKNTHENFFNKTDTEFCFSHYSYPENDVCMSDVLNASFASKTNVCSFGDIQTSMIDSKRFSNSNNSNYFETNQNENNMASCLLNKILEDIEDLRPKYLEIENPLFDQKLNIFDTSLVFTNRKIYHTCGMSESSIAFSEKKPIFFEVEDNVKIDDPKCKEGYLKHNDITNELKLEMQANKDVYVTANDGNLDETSLIKKTILDLFLLEIKIKQCKEVLKKFHITSDSHDSFKKSKLKSAKLIKTYKILMNKRNKENTRLEKSRKRAFVRKNALVENTTIIENTLIEKEEEKYRTEENEIKNSLSHKERLHKKRNKKTDDKMQKPGRSKTLDECIKRVNNSKIYSGRSIKESKCLEEKEISQNQNFKESRNTKVSIKRELLFTKERVPKHKQDSHDPINQTIDKILSELLPVENILNESQSSSENKNNIGLNESVDYVDVSDKHFVIFPYVTT